MSEELFVSVNQLIEMSEVKGNPYDHVVIESSGISEPKSVRAVFQDAESYGVPLMDKVREFVSTSTCVCVLCLCVWILFQSLALSQSRYGTDCTSHLVCHVR